MASQGLDGTAAVYGCMATENMRATQKDAAVRAATATDHSADGRGTPLTFGGLAFAHNLLCAAFVTDRLLASEWVAASGRLVLLRSAGAALGPLGTAAAMTWTGAGGLFLFIAAVAAAMLACGLFRLAISDPVPSLEQQGREILPRTAPVAALLDPAGPGSFIPATEPHWQTGDAGPNG